MYSELGTVLVVDDEPSISDLLYEDLIEVGYDCIKATTGEDALEMLSKDNCDVMLLDLKLPGISGIEVLGKMKSYYPETTVIVVTADGDAQTAVEAMKNGAVDYITKPFELERVNSSIEATLKAKTIGSNRLTPEVERSKMSGEGAGWIRCLDNIAEGVEIRLESLTGLVVTMIEETIDIARSLGIPEDQINKWANTRRKRNTEKINGMNSLLKKLEQNSIAQYNLGMTNLHQCPPSHDSHLN